MVTTVSMPDRTPAESSPGGTEAQPFARGRGPDSHRLSGPRSFTGYVGRFLAGSLAASSATVSRDGAHAAPSSAPPRLSRPLLRGSVGIGRVNGTSRPALTVGPSGAVEPVPPSITSRFRSLLTSVSAVTLPTLTPPRPQRKLLWRAQTPQSTPATAVCGAGSHGNTTKIAGRTQVHAVRCPGATIRCNEIPGAPSPRNSPVPVPGSCSAPSAGLRGTAAQRPWCSTAARPFSGWAACAAPVARSRVGCAATTDGTNQQVLALYAARGTAHLPPVQRRGAAAHPRDRTERSRGSSRPHERARSAEGRDGHHRTSGPSPGAGRPRPRSRPRRAAAAGTRDARSTRRSMLGEP